MNSTGVAFTNKMCSLEIGSPATCSYKKLTIVYCYQIAILYLKCADPSIAWNSLSSEDAKTTITSQHLLEYLTQYKYRKTCNETGPQGFRCSGKSAVCDVWVKRTAHITDSSLATHKSLIKQGRIGMGPLSKVSNRASLVLGNYLVIKKFILRMEC